ncbi:hypothetical protein [Desulfohalovibrio reitneri]|uniref:hypothetical protein n=1 Tax=Desulfohalovibrio reitneri TaxID=1307759 RepID=UPI0004A6EEF9|nr:hypothetical protein [Desulfohalovibrio reitneri]
MTDTRSEYNSTLKGFRNFALHPPPQRLWPELERFIHDFLRQEPDGVEVTEERAAWLASRSEAALRLHVLARSAGPEGPLDLCLDGLGRMGEFGRILFLDLVRRGVADGEAVAGQLARAPVADRVLLCNRALLDPDESPTEPAALALDTLGLLKDESPGEWSRAAGRIGPGNLSFAASHALASGVLGRRLRDLLEAEHPGRETVEAASLLPLLEGAGDALAALASARTRSPRWPSRCCAPWRTRVPAPPAPRRNTCGRCLSTAGTTSPWPPWRPWR